MYREENGLWVYDSDEFTEGQVIATPQAVVTQAPPPPVSEVPTQPPATPVPTATPEPLPAATAKPGASSSPVPQKESAFDENPIRGNIRYGTSGKSVRYLQQRLKELDYFSGTIDGDYGPETLRAIMLFQHAMGYKEQGYLYSDVLDALFSEQAIPYNPTQTLQRGDKGTPVLVLQEKLMNLGFAPGTPDGDYGRATERAVKRFQRHEGLEETGEADTETLEALYAYSDRKITNRYVPQETQPPVGEYHYPGDWVGPASWE